MTHDLKDGIIDRVLDAMTCKTSGLSSGFPDLDRLLEGGFQNGSLYVLGSRPAMGKTGLALSIASNICKEGKRVLFYSLGNSSENIVKRLIRMVSGDCESSYKEAIGIIEKYNLIIDDSEGVPVEVIGMYCDDGSVLEKEDEDIIIIDYLQLIDAIMDGRDTDADTDIVKKAFICKTLKALARKMNIPILLLTQLSGTLEDRPIDARRPKMADLATYDAAGEMADVVMFLYRDEYYNPYTERKGIAEINICKNETGLSGCCQLAYTGFGQYMGIEFET